MSVTVVVGVRACLRIHVVLSLRPVDRERIHRLRFCAEEQGQGQGQG